MNTVEKLTMDNLIVLFIPIVIVGIVVTVSKSKVVNFVSKPAAIYASLIIWTLFGFVFILDNSMESGCVAWPVENLSTENITFSAVSILFLTIGFFLPRKNGSVILLGESIYWIFKLMMVKGGYAVGLGGIPVPTVLAFDIVALTLRLLLLQTRYDFGVLKKAYLIPFAFMLMTLKVTVFN